MSGRELPILKRNQPLPATHYEQVTRAANSVRTVTGDKQYIAADFRHGHLAIRWIGPVVGGPGMMVQRFRVKMLHTDYMVCNRWDGEQEDPEGVNVARTWLSQVVYPINTEIYATRPIGGTGVLDEADEPVEWMDITPVPFSIPCLVKEIENDHLVVTPIGQTDEWLVAKPRLLQHNENYYPALSNMTTVDAQTVNVFDGENGATWKVAPAYEVDDVIYVAMYRQTGVSVGEDNVTMQDTNEDARAWVEVYEAE